MSLSERVDDHDPNTLYRSASRVITDRRSSAQRRSSAFLDLLLLLQQWGTTAGALSVKVSMDLVLRA